MVLKALHSPAAPFLRDPLRLAWASEHALIDQMDETTRHIQDQIMMHNAINAPYNSASLLSKLKAIAEGRGEVQEEMSIVAWAGLDGTWGQATVPVELGGEEDDGPPDLSKYRER